MTNYGQFHDGFFEGLWIDEATVHFFLSTEEKERFTAVTTGVVRLIVDGLREGNIILDVLTREPDEITTDDTSELYGSQSDASKEEVARRFLAEVRQQGLIIFEIDASYGGTCLALVHSVELLPRVEWMRRYCSDVSLGKQASHP